MRIKSLYLENFRGYGKPTVIDFESLTAFVGRNDIGKSSILEALYIFFECGKAITIDKHDVNKHNASNSSTEIVIGVEFDSFNDEIIIDETNKTSLSAEYLLTSKGTLFIVKRFPNGGKAKVYIKANHPSHKSCADLLSKKQKDLKALVEKFDLVCDKTKNAEMRNAIWSHFSDELSLKERDIPVTEEGLKDLWVKLSSVLPIYSLFQSDRSNNDSDKEAQDPLKAAVQLILADPVIQQQLSSIAEIVTEQLKAVTSSTLSKLKEMNEDIAESLNPNIPAVKDLKWAEVFKNVSITSDNDIPINKHGSGVRRLVLLNFFRAEAERQRSNNNRTHIIYAIEEPETSQHLNHQVLLIEALKTISSQSNIQVIITTHSAHIVKHLDFSNIRIITAEDCGVKKVSVIQPHDLPYPSLNEINLLAFGEVSEEFHNELYGFIESCGWKSEYIRGKTTMKYIKFFPDGGTKETEICLSEYIRHQIHHPENKLNPKYTTAQLHDSIEMMRAFIQAKK